VLLTARMLNLPQHLDGSCSRTWRPKYLLIKEMTERKPLLTKCQQNFSQIVTRPGARHVGPSREQESTFPQPSRSILMQDAGDQGLIGKALLERAFLDRLQVLA
jgi:hypothetical protein